MKQEIIIIFATYFILFISKFISLIENNFYGFLNTNGNIHTMKFVAVD